ncbi:MAG: hypothetical protein IPK18_11095 [Sphingobacteriales bacterium]|jgi:hypothetical protein|nr:MAG: hypothetical protein IPK18_11095 [Sphingobacteriales bacterium]
MVQNIINDMIRYEMYFSFVKTPTTVLLTIKNKIGVCNKVLVVTLSKENISEAINNRIDNVMIVAHCINKLNFL